MPAKSHPQTETRSRAGSSATAATAGPSSRQVVPALRRRSDGRGMGRGGGAHGGSSSGSGAVAPARPSSLARAHDAMYGDIVESDVVHDEIRALGTEVKTRIAQHMSRHGTSAEQVAWGVREFGPSTESRKVLNKENEAARMAWERGLYCLWRCTDTPKLRGASMDFCCRVGFRHVCFCGHPLAAHRTPHWAANAHASNTASEVAAATDRQLAQWKSPCEEVGCACAAFRYVPNTPLEIGEGWLTRRANFKASEWSAKCRCGHGHKAHDPAGYLRCRSCGGCSGFASAFLCVVCDLPWEAHETVWESEGMRQQAGLPVREAFAPLADLDDDIRALVLEDASMGGRIAPRLSHPAVQDRPPPSSSTRLPALRGGRGGGQRALTSSSSPVATTAAGLAGASPAEEDAVIEVDYCPGCATIYRSAASKFCSKCGQPRPRLPLPPTTLR